VLKGSKLRVAFMLLRRNWFMIRSRCRRRNDPLIILHMKGPWRYRVFAIFRVDFCNIVVELDIWAIIVWDSSVDFALGIPSEVFRWGILLGDLKLRFFWRSYMRDPSRDLAMRFFVGLACAKISKRYFSRGSHSQICVVIHKYVGRTL
jgi:hypothetical protein